MPDSFEWSEESGSYIKDDEQSKMTTIVNGNNTAAAATTIAVVQNGKDSVITTAAAIASKENGQTKLIDNGHDRPLSSSSSSSPTSSSTTTRTSNGETKSNLYSSMLSNDDIVIVDTTPPITIHRKKKTTSSSNSSRASATIRSLLDDELPQMDTVRKAKDVFETLARKQKQTSDTTQLKANIGRSKSMLVLTGRAWCNGGHRHHNSVCGTAVNGTRTIVSGDGNDRVCRTNLTRSNTLPPQKRYQRSCSNLDNYFKKRSNSSSSSDDEDLNRHEEWERYDRKNSGSPISPEVIRKIREQGTCVTFFGGNAYVEDIPESDDEDCYSDSGIGGTGSTYLMDYDFYRSPNCTSPFHNDNPSAMMTSSLDRHKPKIVSFLSKSPVNGSDGSSPPLSSNSESENTSPIMPPFTDKGFTSSWLLTMEELKSTFNSEDGAVDKNSLRSTSSFGSGCIRLKRRYENENGCLSTRCHGKWLKNPYWSGSYYVIYDFTNRFEEPQA